VAAQVMLEGRPENWTAWFLAGVRARVGLARSCSALQVTSRTVQSQDERSNFEIVDQACGTESGRGQHYERFTGFDLRRTWYAQIDLPAYRDVIGPPTRGT